jgi:hypothetical protein
MNIRIEYHELSGLWVASYIDALGPLGEPVGDIQRDDAVFRLGVEVGRNPQKFTRPLGEYFDGAANEKR